MNDRRFFVLRPQSCIRNSTGAFDTQLEKQVEAVKKNLSCSEFTECYNRFPRDVDADPVKR